MMGVCCAGLVRLCCIGWSVLGRVRGVMCRRPTGRVPVTDHYLCARCSDGTHLCAEDRCTCERCITDLLRGALKAGRRTAKEMQAAITKQPDDREFPRD